MANFCTDIAPNVIFSKDPTAVIDYYVQHKLLGDVCNCPTCQSSMEMVTRPTTSAKDGFGWRCANQRCPKRRTYRTNEQWVFGLADTSSKHAITTWKLLTKEMPKLFYLFYNVL